MKLAPTFLLTAAVLPATALADYKLTTDYSSFDFVAGFDYFTGTDPTNGHVQYKGYATANATGLTGFLVGPNGTNIDNPSLVPPIYLGVDHTTEYSVSEGRPSVRVSSVKTFGHSLVIADIPHMPASTCGLWPAFWMLGTAASWPNAGEIDIIENVNDNDFNMMTLHTSAGVTIFNDTSMYSGTLMTANCDVNAQEQEKNVGCSIKDKSDTNSYGTNFNKAGGGVFAMQYTSDYVAIWFFSRKSIPADITSNKPAPPSIADFFKSAWGKPNALFKPPTSSSPSLASSTASSSSTSPLASNTVIPVSLSSSASENKTSSVLDTHMSSLQLIFDITFCGDWAGKAWASSPTCSKLAPTCEEYVSKNPDAFEEAFWAIQSVKVYEDDTASAHSKRDMMYDHSRGHGHGHEHGHGIKGAMDYGHGKVRRWGWGLGRDRMVMPFRPHV